MAFDFSTAINYTATIPMVRTLSLLVKTRSDNDIKAALENHAAPRIAGYLMTAQDTSGQYIFYSALGDLSDAALADRAEQLVTAVMAEPMVAGFISRIAAAFACAWLLTGDAGSFIDSQQKLATTLENQALADLKHLIRSQILSKGIDSALPKLNLSKTARIFFALDLDATTANKPATGALDTGLATAIVNGFVVQTTVSIGDTPAVIMSNLASAINQAATTTGSINITAGPNEGPEKTLNTTLTTTDIFGVPKSSNVSYKTNLGYLDIFPYKYDNVVDIATVTISLTNDTGGPDPDDSYGIPGIVYGTTEGALSQKGPYSIAIDLETGSTTTIGTTNASNSALSDMLFFDMDNPAFGTLADDTLVYRINGGASQTVDVPANSQLSTVAELLAQDLADKCLDQRVLAAVRPSTRITINGSPATAPGLAFVSFGLEKLYSKFVFTLLKSPTGVRFGVVPNTLVTASNFDEAAKSVIISTHIGSSGTYSATNPDGSSSLKTSGNVMPSMHRNSKKLQSILDQINNPDGLMP